MLFLAALGRFLQNGYTLIRDSQPHIPTGYHLASWFWSAANCN